MSKKTADKAVATTPETTPTAGTGTLTWSDWFDHWPEMFARRWPETFRNIPFGGLPFGEMFRIEQVTDDDGTMVVRAELPGVDPAEDVTIAIEDGRLTISGERHEQTETEDKHGYRSEFQYGSFSRSIRLPAGAHTDDVVATYRDGILEVRVPVDADAPTVRHVPITS
jgi:HSP20 family protein